jgi:hypothetical protein
MSNLERIEEDIRGLSPEERTRLRRWFRELDADAWDHEIEADARSGKLDDLADEALHSR